MDFETQWKKVVEKEAKLEAEQRQKLQQDLLAEFEQMKSRVQKIDHDLIASGATGIGAILSEQSLQFTNTTISFHYRGSADQSGKSSSICVTQGKRGPIELFGVRERSGEITWQIASGRVIFRTDQLLDLLI